MNLPVKRLSASPACPRCLLEPESAIHAVRDWRSRTNPTESPCPDRYRATACKFVPDIFAAEAAESRTYLSVEKVRGCHQAVLNMGMDKLSLVLDVALERKAIGCSGKLSYLKVYIQLNLQGEKMGNFKKGYNVNLDQSHGIYLQYFSSSNVARGE
ncbi:hypothetical protein V6N11_053888 [Hibiscus sabdariffa]|uniref:Uncharacterized protein n=1 Tax=Hibiscus sabdariffa TaxID=183260 RepID=A0ABR2S2F0_9ROSI